MALLDFRGRLGRMGWFTTLIMTSLGIALIGATAAVLVEGATDPGFADAVLLATLGLGAILIIALLGAAIRRLRDAGSPLPLMELLLGLVIPGIGWLWLVYRLFFAGSRGRLPEDPARADPMPVRTAVGTGSRNPARAPRQQSDRTWAAAPDSGANGTVRRRGATGETVHRVARRLRRPDRRNVGKPD